MKAYGLKPLARDSDVSLSEIKAIANRGAAPHASTIERLEMTLQRNAIIDKSAAPTILDFSVCRRL